MGSEIEKDQNVCRLCDRNATSTKMFNVFDKNSEGLQIIQVIKHCLPVIIYRTDPLSKQICEHCVAILDSFYKFRTNTLEIVKKQKDHLRACSDDRSVKLYLGMADGDNADTNNVENGTNTSSNVNVIDRTTSPFENGHITNLCTNCKTFIAEPESNEIEMCAELHKAIAESLKRNNQHLEDNENSESQSRSVALRSKRKRNEGFYAEFEESQDSSVTTDFTYTESTQNTESQSDIELCDSDTDVPEEKEKILPVVKKRRLMGPKFFQEYNERLSIQRSTVMENSAIYNPFSLLRIALNKINSENVPDFYSPTCMKTIVRNQCKYCPDTFANIKLLAVHEAEHINVEMGIRIDDSEPWDPYRDDAELRNKWLETYDGEDEDDDDFDDRIESIEADGDLLVPIAVSSTNQTQAEVKEVVLIDGKPTVNGVPLADLPKDERRTMYRNITISGLKRKFCPLCRYTFKDNWAIESHYFSSSCYYTCRFCGIRFNKQRYQFDEHIKQHELNGDQPSNKVFAPRKWNGALPKVISENKLNPRAAPKQRPIPEKVKPLQMKHLLERKTLQANLRTTSESNSVASSGTAPSGSNQAYFCRKCYQVFFKLDEFNVHVTTCNGGNPQQIYATPQMPKNMSSSSASQAGSINSDTENYSSSGRPVRHCVREVGTYKYKDDYDTEDFRDRPERGSSLKSARGFECGLCDSAFPTVHSRNSHMRIHKNGEPMKSYANEGPYIQPNPYAAQEEEIPVYPDYIDEHEGVQIKQEPLEPIVEINENPHNFPSSIGSVSITPIPKPNVNPNIMKLVQNNPHLTIKSMSNSGYSPSPSGSVANAMEPDRSYKCANCSRSFANKSHLYFHKKNQCGGSKYPCPFCKKRFGTEAAYSSHIFYSHPE